MRSTAQQQAHASTPAPHAAAARRCAAATRPRVRASRCSSSAAGAASLTAPGGGEGGSGAGVPRGCGGGGDSGLPPRRPAAGGPGWPSWWAAAAGLGLFALPLVAEYAIDKRGRGGASLGAAASPPPPSGPQAEVDALLASVRASTGGDPAGVASHAPRRVAIFVEPSPFTYVSGYNTRFRATIRELGRLGVQVLVVTTGAGRSLPGVPFPAGVEPPAEFEGAKVIGAPSFGCPLYWQVPLSFGATPRVWRELQAFKPELVHVTTPGVMAVAAWAFARALDVPLFASYHTHVVAYLPAYGLQALAGPVWAFMRAVHFRAHAVVAASASLAQELVAAGASPAGTTLAWRKAVDAGAFNPGWRCAATRAMLQGLPAPAGVAPIAAAAAAAAAAPADTDDDVADAGLPSASAATSGGPPLLLYVGRLGAEKNLAFLHPLLASAPGARLAVVGDGPARAEAEAMFESDPATRGRALFTGTLRGAALSRAYASADVFLMPSETETLGFVVLEAMAAGLPVLAVAAGGLPDIVTKPGVNGFLYRPGDSAGAAAALARLLADGGLRGRVAAAARREAAGWGWEAATKALLTENYALAAAMHAAGLHRPAAARAKAEEARRLAASGGGGGGAGAQPLQQPQPRGSRRLATAALAGVRIAATLRGPGQRGADKAGRAVGRALVARAMKAARRQ